MFELEAAIDARRSRSRWRSAGIGAAAGSRILPLRGEGEEPADFGGSPVSLSATVKPDCWGDRLGRSQLVETAQGHIASHLPKLGGLNQARIGDGVQVWGGGTSFRHRGSPIYAAGYGGGDYYRPKG